MAVTEIDHPLEGDQAQGFPLAGGVLPGGGMRPIHRRMADGLVSE
jgi:hypothetical protein